MPVTKFLDRRIHSFWFFSCQLSSQNDGRRHNLPNIVQWIRSSLFLQGFLLALVTCSYFVFKVSYAQKKTEISAAYLWRADLAQSPPMRALTACLASHASDAGNMRSKIGVNRQRLSRVTDRCKVSEACYLYNFHWVANISMLCSRGQLRLGIGTVTTTADNYCRNRDVIVLLFTLWPCFWCRWVD